MAIYLARHGKAVSAEKNPERPLSKEGRAEVEKMAELLKNINVKADKIVHSGKKRAEETAQIFSYEIGNGETFSVRGLKPNDSVESFWENIEDIDNIMYVGHLPFMERLVSHVITGNESEIIVKIKTAGVVCLDRDGDSWYIRWLISPEL